MTWNERTLRGSILRDQREAARLKGALSLDGESDAAPAVVDEVLRAPRVAGRRRMVTTTKGAVE